jgi:hypothetical protein
VTPTPTAPPADAAAATPQPTMTVELLGYVGADYAADDTLKQFVQQPNTLLIGSLVLQLKLGDGTPVGPSGSSLDFILTPADAALLAPGGDPTQITVSTFDASVGAMRGLQESIVTQDDGSVSISVGPDFLPMVTSAATSADGTDPTAVDSVDATDPGAPTDATDPAVSADTSGPAVSADTSDPAVSADTSGPAVSADTSDPAMSAEASDPGATDSVDPAQP